MSRISNPEVSVSKIIDEKIQENAEERKDDDHSSRRNPLRRNRNAHSIGGKKDDIQIFFSLTPDIEALLGFDDIDQQKLLALWQRSERDAHKFFVKLRRNLSYYKKTLKNGAEESNEPLPEGM